MVLRPAVAVEIAFDSGYSTPAASRTWTDVTAYTQIVDGIDITHGRGDERGQADANSLRLTLKNSDGRFTPGLASSPYYPNVKIGRPIRVVSTRVGNLVPNPSFEVNATGWAATDGASLARVTTQFDQGIASMSVTGAGALAGAVTSTGTSGFAVTAGQTYTAQARSKAATVARNFSVALAWYNQAGGLISTSTSALVTDSTSAWTSNTITAAAPSTAAFGAVWVRWVSAAAEVHWVDSVMVEQASTAETYGDGSKVGWRWSGTAHQSASLREWHRFNGYVDEWPLEWPAVVDTYATATITATSRHARMGASAPLLNHIYEEYKRDGPAAHYMLDNLTDSVAGGAALVQAGTGTAVTFEGTGPTDGIQAAVFAGGKYLTATLASTTPTVAWIECYFSTTGTGFLVEVTGTQLYEAVLLPPEFSGPSNIMLGLRILAADGRLRGYAFGSAFVTVDSVNVVNDGATHHALLVATNGGNTVLYVDGVAVDTDATANTLGNANRLNVGASALSGAALTGTIAHPAVGYTTISATRVEAHADAGLTGSTGETAEDRLIRYAAFAGVPTAEQAISTVADTPMAHIDTTGQTPLALMQTVAETDGGVLYDSRDGLLTYAARGERYNAVAVVTLDASAGQVGASYAPKLDRFSIINEVVATIADGSDPQETIPAIDQDSYDDYGPHRDDIELATTDADEAHAAAWWRVNTYSEPQARAPQLAVEIAHLSHTLQHSILALDVGDKIAVSSLPSQSDSASKSFFVEGWTERIGPETHTFDFNISPTTGFDVWVLDDATYSVLGTSTKLAY